MEDNNKLYTAMAEVFFRGTVNEYGSELSPVTKLASSWKPSEDFLKKLEEKIDYNLVAESIMKKMTSFNSYDREQIANQIKEKTIQIIAQKNAEKYLQNNK